MNFIKTNITDNIIYNLNYSYGVYFSLRNLNKNENITKEVEENRKKAIIELFIYLAILVGIIIIIIIGYSLYKKYIENKAFNEINEENQNVVLTFQNSQNSHSNYSEEDNHPYSYNNENAHRQNFDSEVASQNNNNNSFNVNHEERMEKIRKKYGNPLVVKILLKKYIEEMEYNKNIFENYGDNCTICVNNFVKDEIIYKTSCEHIFHKNCFNKFLKNIKNNDKLVCPNCNQNLLINKKYLKLRAKPEKIQVKKKESNKMKTSEINFNDEIKVKNNGSEITDKNINSNSEKNNANKNKIGDEIIYISKKKKIQVIKINSPKTDNKNNNYIDRVKVLHDLKGNKCNDSNDNKKTNIYNFKENSIKKEDQKNEKEKEEDIEITINNNVNFFIRKENIKSNNFLKEKKDNYNINGPFDNYSSISKGIDSERGFVNNKKSTFKQNLPNSKMEG